MKKKLFIPILIGALIFGVAYFYFTVSSAGLLEDVSDSDGLGVAIARTDQDLYTLYALANVDDPFPGTFYEGWVVKKVGGVVVSFTSTGRLQKVEDGLWVNSFFSNEDFSDHNFYVVTLEVADDKMPEDHVIEGNINYGGD